MNSPDTPKCLYLLTDLAPASTVAEGSVMDYAVEKCRDSDGNTRCSKPFLVSKSTCYKIEWSTEGALTHTTAEVRDAGSDELVFYRDTNGDWTTKKGEASPPTQTPNDMHRDSELTGDAAGLFGL